MPIVTATPKGMINGEVVTEFTDTTSTTSVTYTYPARQSGLTIENSGVADIYITVEGFVNQVVKPNKKWKESVNFRSFSIRSDVNSQEFVATSSANDPAFLGSRVTNIEPQSIASNTNRLVINQLENLSFTQSDYTIKEMDKDGVIYAIYNNYSIYKSVDNGIKFTLLYTFPSANKIADIKCMDNGELLVACGTDGTNFAKVYVSSNNQTTWTNTLTYTSLAATIHTGWNINVVNKNVLIGEYSLNTDKGAKVYYSNNYGQTFSVIFDLTTISATARHIHGSIYDEYWDRIWVMWGDGGQFSPDNKDIGLAYSDDFGATWTLADIPRQLLVGHAFDNRVIFVADQPPNGIYAYERGRKDEKPNLKLVYKHDDLQRITYITDKLYRRDKNSPLIIPWSCNGDPAFPDKRMLLATYNGLNFQRIWEDTVTHEPFKPFFCVGPTNNNKVVGSLFGDGRTNPSFLPSTMTADFSVDFQLTKSNVIEDQKYKSIINARELGIKGWGYDESAEMMAAIYYCSKNNKTLHIPKDLTVTVKQVRILNLNGIRIKCEGSIKFVDAPQADVMNGLKFTNCQNIMIEEVNYVANPNNNTNEARIDQTYLFLETCTNVRVGLLTYNNTSGMAVKSIGSTNVVIDTVDCKGTETATEFIKVTKSKSVRIKNLTSDNFLRNVDNIYFFNIRVEVTGDLCSDFRVDNAYIRDSGGYVIFCRNSGAGTISDLNGIRFDKLDVVKPKVITNQGVFYFEKVKNVKIKGTLTTEQSDPATYAGRGVMFNDVDGLDCDVEVSKFNNGYFMANVGTLKNAKVSGIVSDMLTAGMTLKILESVTFENLLFKNNGINGSSQNINNVSNVTSLKNVRFKNIYFGKSGGSNNLYLSPALLIEKVLFEDCDFTEWTTVASKLQVNVAGTTRRNNKGLNWDSAPPTTQYWNVGEIIYNTAPAASGFLGWVCVTDGTPGTWKGFGAIEA